MHESTDRSQTDIGTVHHGACLPGKAPNPEERAIADGTSGLPWQARTGD